MVRAIVAAASVAMVLCGCGALRAVPSGPTAEEIERYSEQALDQAWLDANQPAGTPRPVVERDRYISTVEWDSVMRQCVRDQGFPDYELYGTELYTPRADEVDALAHAWYVCTATFPIDPHELGVLSTRQLDYLYDYFGTWLVPCLAHQGYLPLDEPPTREQFVGGYEGYQGYAWWSPYYSVTAPEDPVERQRLEEICPYAPPGLFDYLP